MCVNWNAVAEKEIEAGDTVGPFETAAEAVAYLEKL